MFAIPASAQLINVGNVINNVVQPVLNPGGIGSSSVSGVPKVDSPGVGGVNLPVALPNVGGLAGIATSGAQATVTNVTTGLGTTQAVDLVGDGLTSIAVDKNMAAKVNLGNVKALSASNVDALVGGAINLKGFAPAQSASVRNGVIILGAPPVSAKAIVKAAALKANADVSKNMVADKNLNDKTLSKASRLQKAFADNGDLYAGNRMSLDATHDGLDGEWLRIEN